MTLLFEYNLALFFFFFFKGKNLSRELTSEYSVSEVIKGPVTQIQRCLLVKNIVISLENLWVKKRLQS